MKYYWIKERHNTQIGIYYVPLGKLSIKDAKRWGRPIYGDNYLLKFATEEEYQTKIQALIADNQKVR